LIPHDPEPQKPKRLDLFNAEIDIQFTVHIKKEKKWLTLYKSRHTYEEELSYLCDFIKNNSNMIFRELVMNEWLTNPDTALRDRKTKIATALHEDQELGAEDSSLGGFYAGTQGDLYFFRTNYAEAGRWYLKALDLLQPAVFDKFPTYKEAMILFHCCARLADCVDVNRNAELKANYINNLGIVGQHLIKTFPEENDYKRLMASALFRNAEMGNYLQAPEIAAEDLSGAIAILETLYEQIPNAENYRELCRYKTNALQVFADSAVSPLVPLQQWKKDIAALNENAEEIIENDKAKQKEGPVWLKEANAEKWAVELFHTSLLRYTIAVPKRWNASPFLSNTQLEVKHLFKGPWPSEFLSVSFMENATGGNMTGWVDGTVALSGLPVLEISTATNPKLSEWLYEGVFEVVAKKYEADEAHCYSGIIELNDADRHRARVYILLLRKGNFAWKFILSFETALFSGMPASVLFSNDHIRAGCTFGKLKLG
jgi:tetratricopeptide (TPR) repeat protein